MANSNNVQVASLVCGLCTVYHYFFFFSLPHGVIGRLLSVIVALPGHPLYAIFVIICVLV